MLIYYIAKIKNDFTKLYEINNTFHNMLIDNGKKNKDYVVFGKNLLGCLERKEKTGIVYHRKVLMVIIISLIVCLT